MPRSCHKKKARKANGEFAQRTFSALVARLLADAVRELIDWLLN